MKPPWSTNQLKRLGDALRDEATLPDSLPDYLDVVAWYNDLAAEVHSHVESLEFERVDGVSSVQVSSRAKTIDTLRDKLRREWPIRLPSIQDVAGVRVNAAMSLTRQDAVAKAIVRRFDHSSDAIHDLRKTPHSGYRAVHVWLRLPEGRVEVQIRTMLQSAWANTYEALADLAGREIRYGGEPSWLTGVPEFYRDIRTVRPNAAISSFPESMRIFSAKRIAVLEQARQIAEFWRPAIEGAPAPDIPWSEFVETVRQQYESAPNLPERADQLWDPTSPEAPENVMSAITNMEGAIVSLLDEMRDQMVRIRSEIQEGN